MKRSFLLLLFILICVQINAQCDSLERDVELRIDTLNTLSDYDDQINYLDKCVKHFIDCDFFSEAIMWQWNKYYIAFHEGRYADQSDFLENLDVLIQNYKGIVEPNLSIEYTFESLISWSQLNYSLGYYKKAIAQLKSAELLIASEIETLPDEIKRKIVDTYRVLGSHYSQKNEHQLAITYFNKAIEFCKFRETERGRYSNLSLNLLHLAVEYFELKDQENALLICRRSLLVSKKLFELAPQYYEAHLRTSFKNLAKWHLYNNSLDSAKYYINKSRQLEEVYNKSFYSTDVLMAKIFLAKNDHISSTRLIMDQIIRNDTPESFIRKNRFNRAFDMIDLLIKSKEVVTAKSLIEAVEDSLRLAAALSIQKDLPIYNIYERNYLQLLFYKIILDDATNLDSILVFANNAYNIIKGGAKSISLDMDKVVLKKQAYFLTQHLLQVLPFSRTKYHNTAFSAIESAKSGTLFSAWLRNSIVSLKNEESIFSQELTLENQILTTQNSYFLSKDEEARVSFESKLNDFEGELDSIRQLLKSNYPNYFRMKYNWQNPSLQEVQEVLTTNEVYINYFEGEEKLYAMLVNNNTSKIIEIPNLGKVRDLIAQFSTLVFKSDQNTARQEIKNTSFALYQHLMEPFAEELKEKIIISPSGSLHHIPFSALLQSKDLDSESMLIFDHAVSYTPSASMFVQGRSSQEKQIVKNGLFIAPKFFKKEAPRELMAMRSSMGELIFNVQEVESISPIMKNQSLLNENASKSAFISNLEDTDLLHFATHAKANEDAPDRSFIAFYSNNAEESDTNLLYLDELSKLHMPVKMVVLSACETGLGKIYKGEGAMSLANACFYAGSESVIATLWAVQDQTTFEIMKSFYGHLEDGEKKDKALQMAQIDFIRNNTEDFQHPYYWAGFSVIGNTIELDFRKSHTLRNSILFATSILILIIAFFFLRRTRHIN